MPKKRKLRGEPSHHDDCDLHEKLVVPRCVAMTKFRGQCLRQVKKYDRSSGFMPLCYPHRHKWIEAGRCKAVLECGFPCGKLIEWKYHEIQLCGNHIHMAQCYFLNLPPELRLQIYRLLFPDRAIPAVWYYGHRLRSDNQQVNIAILRTCRQIYLEAVPELYRFPFSARVKSNEIAICNKTGRRWHPNHVHRSALYGYGSPASTLDKLLSHLDTQNSSKPKLWHKFPLPDATMSRMRIFHVEVLMLEYWSKAQFESQGQYLNRDMVRRLMERLRSIKQIQELKITVTLAASVRAEDALDTAAMIMQPVRCLKKVKKLTIAVKLGEDLVGKFNCTSTLYTLKCSEFQRKLRSSRWASPPSIFRPLNPAISLERFEILAAIFYHPMVDPYLDTSKLYEVEVLHEKAIKACDMDEPEVFKEINVIMKEIFTSYVRKQASIRKKISCTTKWEQ